MTYTFELTGEEANIVAAGLGELQLKVGLPVLSKLKAQCTEQNRADKAKQVTTERPEAA